MPRIAPLPVPRAAIPTQRANLGNGRVPRGRGIPRRAGRPGRAALRAARSPRIHGIGAGGRFRRLDGAASRAARLPAARSLRRRPGERAGVRVRREIGSSTSTTIWRDSTSHSSIRRSTRRSSGRATARRRIVIVVFRWRRRRRGAGLRPPPDTKITGSGSRPIIIGYSPARCSTSILGVCRSTWSSRSVPRARACASRASCGAPSCGRRARARVSSASSGKTRRPRLGAGGDALAIRGARPLLADPGGRNPPFSRIIGGVLEVDAAARHSFLGFASPFLGLCQQILRGPMLVFVAVAPSGIQREVWLG